MIQIERILVPTDFSTFSRIALRHGCELAKRFNAELHILNVIRSPLHDYVERSEGGHSKSFADYEQDQRDEAEQKLRQLDLRPLEGSERVTYVTRGGSTIASITQYARAQNIDLIVMGTHGRTGLQHVLVGSVAENIVRTATCPVLTVRHPEHEFVLP